MPAMWQGGGGGGGGGELQGNERQWQEAKRTFHYSGFVDANGVAFEDFGDRGWGDRYAIVFFLLPRAAVGVVVGATVSPSEAEGRRAIVACALVLATYLARRDSAEHFSRLNAVLAQPWPGFSFPRIAFPIP